VPLIEGAPDNSAAAMTLEQRGKVRELQPMKDFLPRAFFGGAESTVSAPAAFAGHGISAPELGYDDFAHIDVRGHIAVILTGAPPTFPNDQRAFYSSNVYKYRELVNRGAVGVVYINTPADEKSTPWERLVLLRWIPAMRWTDESGTPFDAFSELRGKFIVSRAGAKQLFRGAPRSLERAFAYSTSGRAQGFELPAKVTLTTRTALRPLTSTNVAGMLEGSDPALKSEYIVFTAHLDHLGRGAPVNGDAIYNGALDNASGTAIMIEVARYLASLKPRPLRSMIFLAVTAEVKGLLGSDYFARHPTVPAASLVANVNMDMPVALTPLSDLIAFGAEHSSLGPVAARAAARENMTLAPDPNPAEVIFVRSDQYCFVRQGVPAIYLDAGTSARTRGVDGKALFEEFLRTRYHMPGDDLSQPIDYGTLAALGRVNARIGIEVGNAPQRPSWNAGDFFGERFGTHGASGATNSAK